MQSPAAGREREFGAAAAGPAARHFGASAGVAHASLGERGFGHARGGPRKSPSGRVFVYHGQPHARFAGQRYQWPQGQTYRRFAVGRSLPQTYWLQDYFIEDYADYGLAEPPADYAWIRYGPDLLLINLETGRIDQIVYGAFDEVDQAYLDQPPDDQQPAYAQPDDAGQE